MKNSIPDCLDIAAAVTAHRTTARTVVDSALARAEQYQEKWRPFIRVTSELARKQAERVDRLVGMGKRLPLAGVPFAVKDLYDVKGTATTCGSKAFADDVKQEDAASVQRLVSAGAVLIGKLNMHECAFGFTGENATYGDCKNPFNDQRVPGGSSSGSAVAVALGICPLTLGSDTGGSIRLPSALCNLTGLKPTYGRVSRRGVVPLSWTLDHVGPMTRTAREAAVALRVLAGHDTRDETSSHRPVPDYLAELDKPLKGLRIGIPKKWFYDALEEDVAAAVEKATDELVRLGGRRVEVELPYMDEVLGAHRAIIFSEASSYYQGHVLARPEKFADDIRPLLLGGLFVPAVDYLKAQRVRRVVRRAWSKAMAKVDCLVTPSSPIVASRFGQQSADLPGGEKPLVRAYLDVTLPFNLSGHPALSMPCGFSRDQLPIGLQVVGKPFAEATILAIAHQYQQQTDWHRQTTDTK